MVQHAALIAATIATGLLAGVFYGFACSVMIALRRVDDRTFIEVMRRINAAVQNGWFMLSFLGGLVFTVLAGILQIGSPPIAPIAIALVLNIAGLAVTFGVNIPLNVQLDRAGRADRIADPPATRRRFEGRWARWNVIRALLHTASFGFLCWALELNGV